MSGPSGFLVLESGEILSGTWPESRLALPDRAGEIVFNTSHSGFEEIATDPSYLGQIVVFTAPQQGNYPATAQSWESKRIWIEGLICVEMQSSKRERSWAATLEGAGVPILTGVDTRRLTLILRGRGTSIGALVRASDVTMARAKAAPLIQGERAKAGDWAYLASRLRPETSPGQSPHGPKVAAIDLGCKENSLRELKARAREVRVFPSRAAAAEIRAYDPDLIFLSNGPGDPEAVEQTPRTVAELLGWKPIFGICMGHQVLGRAMGGQTYRLKFGHRGANHPIEDRILNRVYMSSQNHGYAIKTDSLPASTQISHVNLNDGTIAGIYDPKLRALGVQFHPESCPGPHEASALFDFFVGQAR